MSGHPFRPDASLPPGTTGLALEEPLLFERGAPGRSGASLPPVGVPEVDPASEIPARYLRGEPEAGEGLPEVSEPEVVRHFTRISQWNYGIDSGLFPLGSCTMKYNPRVNEAMARLPGIARAHPFLEEEDAQGPLRLMYELEQALCGISGLDACTLQPAAGAQGELAGVLIIRAWQEATHGRPRSKILVPASAHGTNPATSALAGYEVVEIRAGEQGWVHAETVKEAMDDEVAGIMLTNPNTLGIFEREIAEIASVVHEGGGLVYCDGANLNALMGHARPGDMGVDLMHFNLHKTFSTPHGGGGPGAGPVAVRADLERFLPIPRVVKEGEAYRLVEDRPDSIGALKAFYGNFGVLARAHTFIRELGAAGLKSATELAVLNARYLRHRLESEEGGAWPLAFASETLHESVFTDAAVQAHGVSTLDVAKRLIDFGFHPPTVYFPLVVSGALMIEPTETETREGIEAFVAAMAQIAREAKESPELLHAAPTRPVRERLDETRAARRPILRWTPEIDDQLEKQGG
ncbi:MAG: aminomethyl-transferring glycine dehydrogenase subunit GcvPB [Deltaproteobacteria bacterium]|nr:aminomethyl-transferring glycine dehydrogenase subunit GcvPB [Deltaproteobacteria bacterium]